jgi:periplasmic protein TonB
MFEATLNTYRTTGTARRKLAVMPIAILLHVVALVGVTLAQIWAVPDVPEPMVTATFYQVPPPPPAPPRPAGPKPATPRVTAPVRPVEPVQPTEIPATIPKSEPTDQGGGGVPGGDPDGDPNGTINGVPFGMPGDNPTSTEVAVPREEPPIRIGGEVVAPVAISRQAPGYPEVARRARIQGQVFLEAIIDKNGNVVDVRILRDIGMGCGAAAQEAVQRWRYRPATLNGRNVAVYLTVVVNFGLS